jgi:hypothetical protein
MSVFRGASVGITLTANKSRFSAEMKAARAELRGWERTVQQSSQRARSAVRGVVTGVGLIGAAGLAAALHEGTSELIDMQKVGAQTDQIVGRMGRSAFVTTKQVEGLSQQILRMSGIDDQAVQGAANLVLTMGRLDNSTGRARVNMNRATMAAADLSTRLGGDVTAAAKMVGKALAEPEKASGKLGRTIGGLTEAQNKQIEAAMKANDVARAQDVILTALEQKVGGAAKAYGETAPAQIAKAREAFAGVAADLVARGVPAFLEFTREAERSVHAFEQWSNTPEGQKALSDISSLASTAAGGIREVGSAAFDGVQFLAAHKTAVLSVVGGYLAFRTVNAVLTPLNAAFQIGQVNAARFATANTGAARSAMVMRGVTGALGGPIGITSLAVGGLATGLLTLKQRQDAANDKAREARDALYEQARAAGSVVDANLALASSKLGIKEASAATKLAADVWRQAVAQEGAGSKAARDASIALQRAKLTEAEARRRNAATIDEERGKQIDANRGAQAAADALNEITAARKAYNDAKSATKNADNTKEEIWLAGQEQVAKKHLENLEKNEKLHQSKIAEYHKQGRGTVERIDGQFVVRSGQRASNEAKVRERFTRLGNEWSAAQLAKYAGMVKPSVDRSNRQLEKVGQADRAKIAANIRSSFGNISQLVQNAIGAKAISIPINFLAKFMGVGDAFDAGGLPSGVKPQLGPYAAVAQAMGLGISPGAVRPAGTRTASGGVSDHTTGNALDLAGSPAAMMRFAKAARQMPRVKQVIYSPLGLSNGGSPFGPIGNAAVQRMHYNHVHVAAFAKGGRVGGRTTGPELFGMRGEDGEEQIVPLSPKYRSHGIENLKAAAAALGVPMFASGGFIGGRVGAVQAARDRASLAGNPAAALRAAQQAFVDAQREATNIRASIAAMRKGGVTATEKADIARLSERLSGITSNFASLADDIVSKEQGAADARRAASDAEIEAARVQSDAAIASLEASKQAAAEQRQRELDLPRSILTLADANLELQKVMAEGTATLDDDIQQRRNAIAVEDQRQAEIQKVLARTDLTDEERAQAIRDLAASISASAQITADMNDLTSQVAAASGGATLDDVIAELRSVGTALFRMGATEAGNVFQVAKLEQIVQGGGVDMWELQTTAGLQGAVL